MTARIACALALAAATCAPIQVADRLMDQLAIPAQHDLAGRFTRDIPLLGIVGAGRGRSAGTRRPARQLADDEADVGDVRSGSCEHEWIETRYGGCGDQGIPNLWTKVTSKSG